MPCVQPHGAKGAAYNGVAGLDLVFSGAKSALDVQEMHLEATSEACQPTGARLPGRLQGLHYAALQPLQSHLACRRWHTGNHSPESSLCVHQDSAIGKGGDGLANVIIEQELRVALREVGQLSTAALPTCVCVQRGAARVMRLLQCQEC